MRTSFRLAAVLALLLSTVGACGQSDEGPGEASPSAAPTGATTSSGTASGTASPTTSSGAGATLPEDLRTRPAVVAAIADAAQRRDVSPDDVVVAAWTPVTWTDGSLGCPQEGMSYTQALVEGELLVLRVGGGLLEYHARTGGTFGYCATPSAGYGVGG